jgi:hypothetical protein
MKTDTIGTKRIHSPLRWWAALVAALVLLFASLAAGAVGHYLFGWF